MSPSRCRWCYTALSLWLVLLVGCSFGQPTSSGGLPSAAKVSASHTIVFSDGETLWLIDPTLTGTAARRQLLNMRGKGTITDPAWAPDRSQLVFAFTPSSAREGDFGSDLYLLSTNGGTPRLLFSHDVAGGLARAPVWAPNGSAIYFSYSFTVSQANQTTSETTQRIERLELATNQRTIVATEADLPTLSPDGSRLAFVHVSANPDEPAALWIASASGSEARLLVPATSFQALWAPRFAPDGRHLLFAAAGGDRSRPRLRIIPQKAVGATWPPTVAAHGLPMDLWLVDVTSGQLELLAALGADDPYAIWSPDGKQIAYLTADGLSLIELTNGDTHALTTTIGFGALDWAR